MHRSQKVHPRLPGAWEKALDFYRLAKSAKIRLRLIYLISHSSSGTYRELRSESNSILKTMWVVRKTIRVKVF